MFPSATLPNVSEETIADKTEAFRGRFKPALIPLQPGEVELGVEEG